MNNKAMYKLSYGLFILSAKEGDKDNACINNTAIQAAADPNQMSIALNKTNFTHNMIKNTGKFNISVINKEVTFDIFKRFGFQSGRDTDKFDGFTGYSIAPNGIRYITESTNAYFSINVKKNVDLGSHTMFIGEIKDMEVLNEIPSATYEYYQNNIKPKPKNPKETKGTVWRCRICGYEYIGEEIPADFICPICKHPASDFEKIEK